MNLKALRPAFVGLLLLGAGAAWLHFADKNYIYGALYHNFADIDDHLIFEQRTIHASVEPQPWPHAPKYNQLTWPSYLQEMHEDLESVAFVVIHKDSVVHEQYWQGYSNASLSNSFSMAKSVVSILIGAALRDGYIKSINQPVADFLPSFKQGDKRKITLKHLLMMSSGLNWDESYGNPLSVTTEAYYGDDLKKVIDRLEPETEPGKAFSYKSGDTQILALVLEAATGKQLSQYAEDKLWKPLGAMQNAGWSVDKPEGIEKAYCCLFSNAPDFARIGKLYLQNGIWNNDTIVDPAFVRESITPHGLPTESGEVSDFYGYQWWLLPDYKGQDIFYARGILGQYVIVIPEKELIIVRLGKERDKHINNHPGEVYIMIDAANEVIR